MSTLKNAVSNGVLDVLNLCLRRENRIVLAGISLQIKPGQFTAIIGPNGAGKSTLMAALAGLRPIKHNDGDIRLDGLPIGSFSKSALSKRIAFLPAQLNVPFPLTISALIDQAEPFPEAKRDAIRAMELTSLEFVPLTRLSTGEVKRAWIAMILARQTPIVLLDEPLSGLDPRYQMRLLETLQSRVQAGASVVIIAHDLPYASRVDRVVALRADANGVGRVIADGTPIEVLQLQILRDLYGVDVWISTDPTTGVMYSFPTRAI